MKVLSIGDLHGRSIWKDFIFGGCDKFEDWAIECESGDYVRPWEETLDLRFSDIDKIVFIGDYFDSFTVSNVEMKKNVEDLFLFKRCYPDKVVLLWGNHDVHYWYRDEQCSGFRGEMFVDFHEILWKNRHHLQLAHQEGNVLWTHAGVTDSFYKKLCLKKSKERIDEWTSYTSTKDGMFEKPTEITRSNIATFLNEMWEEKWERIFNVGKIRGGFSFIPGPLWADKRELTKDILKYTYQIVGHTPIDQIYGVYENNSAAYFIDCLERGAYKAVVVVELDESNMYKNIQIVEQ